jgi:hypothetical protein
MAATAGIVAAGATVASAGASILKSTGGGDGGAAAGGQAADFRAQASQLWNDLKQPDFNKAPLQAQSWLQDYAPTNYTAQTGKLFQSSDDPTSIANENTALGQMQRLAQGGLQPADLIALQQIQGSQAGAASAQSLAVQDQLRARGLGGAGASEAAMLSANQGAANSANSLYNNAIQQAMSRQTAAITASANDASAIRGQDNTISQQMAANNNAFNTQTIGIQNAAAIAAMNNSNAAQAANQAGRQAVANNTVTTANQNVALQNQLAQQAFNNQSTQIAGQSSALNGQATLASQQQAADALKANAADQSLTAGLNGLGSIAKSFAPTNNNNGNNSSSPSWFSNLTGNGQPVPQTSPNDGVMVDTSTWGTG